MLASILNITLIVGGTVLLSWPLGKYMSALFSGRFVRADQLFAAATGGHARAELEAILVRLARL